MGGSPPRHLEESIIDDSLFMPIHGLYRVTRDWLQVKAAGQLRSRFETAGRWRERIRREHRRQNNERPPGGFIPDAGAELRRAGDVSPLIRRAAHNQWIDIPRSPKPNLNFHCSPNMISERGERKNSRQSVK
jgi:hypothetical protein